MRNYLQRAHCVEPAGCIRAYVSVVLSTDGSERIMQYFFAGADHRTAAAQAFKYASDGVASRIRSIETYDVEPRRWNPDFAVEELT